MNKEERQLLIAKFWCDIFKIACVEPGINPVDAANDAVKKFSERFPEEETGEYYCAICNKNTNHTTQACHQLYHPPQKLGPGFLGGIS